MRHYLSPLLAFAVLSGPPAAAAQAMDPANPTCPLNPNWSDHREMQFTVATIDGHRVLLGEGAIDDNLLPRLEAALRDPDISEVRLRSPGGNARVGNQAGILLRQAGLQTRIPAGWACAGSCAFMFMGGIVRFVDPGGLIVMQMFTFTGDREAIRRELSRGPDAAVDLMSAIAVGSARVATDDNDYLMRMGVMRTLLTDIAYRQRGVAEGGNGPSRRCLTQAELARYNVTNQVVGRP